MKGSVWCGFLGCEPVPILPNLFTGHDVSVPNTSILAYRNTWMNKKAPFCLNFLNSFEPICKHNEPSPWHMGLKGALMLTEVVE